jgi:DNA-binding HxlR family transcriptional regulator
MAGSGIAESAIPNQQDDVTVVARVSADAARDPDPVAGRAAVHEPVLDVVGERWALLVVRELLLGPQRFSDLRRALAGASSNLVADRLRELEGRGVVRRRELAPPASSWVYELAEWGRELEPIVLALGSWGARVPFPPAPTTLSATSVLLFLRTSALTPRR